MSTAASSVAETGPSLSVPTTQVTVPQWQSFEQYQQYYNYYQAMSQASVSTTTVAATSTDQTAAYTQDYSKAWEEYYKAYYGQAYATAAPPSQYPATGYSYDQYGYPNLTAPPPSYQYESVSAPAAYQYSQPPAVVVPPVVAAPPSATSFNYTVPTSTVPPTSTWSEPPPSFESQSGYNLSQSYQQSSTYDNPPTQFEHGNAYTNGSANKNVEEDNFLERFPKPPFDTGPISSFGNRGGRYRGRGYNKDSRDENFRRPIRDQGNKGTTQQGYYNDRTQSNYNKSQFNDYEQTNYNNEYQNCSTTSRGRGFGNPYRGRGGENTFRGRGRVISGDYGDFEQNNKGYSGDEFNPCYNNDNSQSYDNENRNSANNFNQKNDFSTTKESPWDFDEDDEWDSQCKKPKMSDNQEQSRPTPLMDIVVQPTDQSSIVLRRQALIDRLQNKIRDFYESNIPVDQHWETVKSALSPDMQKKLLTHFVRGQSGIKCEVYLEDIFLVQSQGYNEDLAIEEAGKIILQMFQERLFVRTATRGCAADKVPVFCVSRSSSGPVSLPPINTNTFSKNMDANITVCKDFAYELALDSKTDRRKRTTQDAIDLTPIQKVVTNSKPMPQSMRNQVVDDLFLVVDSVQNDKDQSISIMTNTGKFNKITIDYKHEKPENATHISQCIITINGEHLEMAEARDYLVAKREAADKAVAILKLRCSQIALSFDRAVELAKADVAQTGKSIEESACDWLKRISGSEDDTIYRLSQSFNNQERDTINKMAVNLNLSTKQESSGVLFIFRQYPIDEMKKRLLRQGFCAQYRLIVNRSTDGNK